MGVTFGRDFETAEAMAGMRPMRVYKWSHAGEVFRAAKAHADHYPYTDPHEPDTTQDVFKLYDEVPGDDGRRELLIECKLALRRLDYLGGVYQLYCFPLRGTDLWAVIQEAQQVFGPPQTMVFDDPGLSVYFSAPPAPA